MRPQTCVFRRFMKPGFARARSNISGLKWRGAVVERETPDALDLERLRQLLRCGARVVREDRGRAKRPRHGDHAGQEDRGEASHRLRSTACRRRSTRTIDRYAHELVLHGGEALDGDAVVEARVFTPPDLVHFASADRRQKLVGPELRSGLKRHRVRGVYRQSRTTVRGAGAASSAGTSIRNRWPSAVTTYRFLTGIAGPRRPRTGPGAPASTRRRWRGRRRP